MGHLLTRHTEQGPPGVARRVPATDVVTIEGARLFFPDERAAELVTHLRAHWAAHPGNAREPGAA